MNLSVTVLIVVFLLIAVRQVGNVRLQIWQIMLAGAVAVVAFGEISIREALHAINLDVMLFLFGMFVVGQALEESGYLAHAAYQYFKRAHSVDILVLMILFGVGALSAILMNDTLAIIGTPVVLLLARKHEMSPTMLLLSLCFAVTIGSVMSPIGNPQNLLIALNGTFVNPFVDFFRWLFIPTIVNLFIAYAMLKKFYRNDFHDAELAHSQEPIRDHHLALLSKIALGIVVVLVIAKILLVMIAPSLDFRLTLIALAAALPIVVGSDKRWRIVKHTDWHTLAFFAAMFVLMESVWRSGFFQRALQTTAVNTTAIPTILFLSVSLSQCISNVPMVALVQPMLLHAGAGAKELVALAAGSTIAGNLFILGAASNVIVIQNAERRSHHTIGFWEFAKVGVPLTLCNVAVYWLFLVVLL